MTVRLDELGQAELMVRMRLAHDRGVFNESAFLDVLQELNADHPLTQDHLIQIFGVGAAVRVCAIPDETARQLVREAVELLTNADCQLDIRDWVRAAEHLVGPIQFRQAVEVEPVATRYHAHLDICEQCRVHPFDQCTEGVRLLRASVSETSETRGPRP